MRVAYALDDEISWGAFVVPIPWRINDDDASVRALAEGLLRRPRTSRAAVRHARLHPAQLDRPLGKLDFSPLLDRITYNDSVWATSSASWWKRPTGPTRTRPAVSSAGSRPTCGAATTTPS